MILKAAAIHYAQVVDELMDRRLEWLQENEPEWLEHMTVARLQLLAHTGTSEIRKGAKKVLAHMAG
jgi:hypothetical protein